MAKNKGVAVHLPIDAVIADNFSESANTKLSAVDNIPEGWMGLDVGPKTSEIFAEVLIKSQNYLMEWASRCF